MKVALAHTILFLASCGCSGPDVVRTASDDNDASFWSNAPVLAEDTPIDSLAAIDFFRALKHPTSASKPLDFVTVREKIPKGWVTRSDVAQLMEHIRSNERAYCVVSVLSSYLPVDDSSTVGGQAMDLIDLYRFNLEYPPLWSCAKTDTDRIASITKWWSEGGLPEDQELNYPKK